jgi:catechol 2,3-dioxygenase-like lactoylglutathione lyase family enzyme
MKSLVAAGATLIAVGGLRAQILPFDQLGIVMGHIHLNVVDVEAQKRFFTSQFDAKPFEYKGIEGVKVPGMLILFTKKPPTHPSSATVLDHFGLKVRSREEMITNARTSGYEISRVFIGSEGFANAYIVGPDGINIELREDLAQKVRAEAHHLHYYLPDFGELRTWYLAAFPMRPTTRGPHPAADIPGMNLSFSKSNARDLGSKGGLIDHIGFEVRDLSALCKKLMDQGIKVDMESPSELGLPHAFVTDPKGILIELTEGLARHQ